MTVFLSGHQHFPWGYQIRADFTAVGGRVFNEVLIFKTTPVATDPKTGTITEWLLPPQADIDKAVTDREVWIAKMIADEAAEFAPKLLGHTITNEDGTVISL